MAENNTTIRCFYIKKKKKKRIMEINKKLIWMSKFVYKCHSCFSTFCYNFFLKRLCDSDKL